jgi:hypothetical protein
LKLAAIAQDQGLILIKADWVEFLFIAVGWDLHHDSRCDYFVAISGGAELRKYGELMGYGTSLAFPS